MPWTPDLEVWGSISADAEVVSLTYDTFTRKPSPLHMRKLLDNEPSHYKSNNVVSEQV